MEIDFSCPDILVTLTSDADFSFCRSISNHTKVDSRKDEEGQEDCGISDFFIMYRQENNSSATDLGA